MFMVSVDTCVNRVAEHEHTEEDTSSRHYGHVVFVICSKKLQFPQALMRLVFLYYN